MDLVKITDLTNRLNITSRSLRYYEKVGLLQSVRPANEAYRYYDAQNIERLRQILVLRKMQIPIKDILRIYGSADMRVVVDVFTHRLLEIDDEVNALTHLRRITDAFLQTMMRNGIRKISTLPLLYDEMERTLDRIQKKEPDRNEREEQERIGGVRPERPEKLDGPETHEAHAVRDSAALRFDSAAQRFVAAAQRPAPTPDMGIVDLPAIRCVTSWRRASGASDVAGFWDWLQGSGIPAGRPGSRSLFEAQDEAGQTVILQRIDPDYGNRGPFADGTFLGGLFAVAAVYADEDIAAFFRGMIESFDDNPGYEVDYRSAEVLRHLVLAETVFSAQEARERIQIYLPVKRRLPDISRYRPAVPVEAITAQEIEAANPILWTRDVPMTALEPEAPWAWSYRVNDRGEGEYAPTIDAHSLKTGVVVSLPFRVDIAFRVDDATAAYGYGADEGNLCFIHDGCTFGVNRGNYAGTRDEAIGFHQPIFGNPIYLPKIGAIREGAENRLTWIVGERHFAVIVNGEVRFCGTDFPYMAAKPHDREPQPVLLAAGGSGKRILLSLRISQLKPAYQHKVQEGALTMTPRQSNNRLAILHRLIQSDHGENYWFCGCAKYVMECLGEPEYTYAFFAGLTGDVLAQVYSGGPYLGNGVTEYLSDVASNDGINGAFIEGIFQTCGYECTMVAASDLRKNREMYVQTLVSYIDRGIPVIQQGYSVDLEYAPWGVFVGYEAHGRTLLMITGDQAEPVRVPLEDALSNWFFVGQKIAARDPRTLYRKAIEGLPALLTTRTDTYCFGAEAFRRWAADIEGGFFDDMEPEAFDSWDMYVCYVCNLATNGSCSDAFFDRALELNPDFAFLADVIALYRKMGRMWERDPDGLEAMGGGFNITLEALKDPARRGRIAAKLTDFAACADEIVRILETGLSQG